MNGSVIKYYSHVFCQNTWVQEEELLSYDDDLSEPSFIASRPSSPSRLFSTASRLRPFSTVSMIFCTAAGPFAAQDPLKSQDHCLTLIPSFSFLLNYFNKQEDAYGKSLLSKVHQGKEVFPRQQNKSRTSNPYIKLAFFWTTDDDGFQ